MRVGAGDTRNGTEQVDERSEVVGAHVEHWAAADLVVELRVGVPALVAGTGIEGGGGHRLADPAIVNQLAAGLDAAAQERVGRAADAHALGLGRGHGPLPVGAIDGQRLLAVDVLARCDGHQVDQRVRLGPGDVDHDLEAGNGEQLLVGQCRRARRTRRPWRAPGSRRGRRRRQRRGCRRRRAAVEVGRADVAATDDANLDFPVRVHVHTSHARLRIDLVQHAREGDRLADMGQLADPGHHALDAHAEAGMGHGAVAAQVEIPGEGLARQLVLGQALLEQRQVVDALAAADDLAVALRARAGRRRGRPRAAPGRAACRRP